MRKGGDGGDGIWVTEIGWGSDTKVQQPAGRLAEKQAKLLKQTYEMMIAKRNQWNLQGCSGTRGATIRPPRRCAAGAAQPGWSISDLDAKPAWHAYTKLTGGSAG